MAYWKKNKRKEGLDKRCIQYPVFPFQSQYDFSAFGLRLNFLYATQGWAEWKNVNEDDISDSNNSNDTRCNSADNQEGM